MREETGKALDLDRPALDLIDDGIEAITDNPESFTRARANYEKGTAWLRKLLPSPAGLSSPRRSADTNRDRLVRIRTGESAFPDYDGSESGLPALADDAMDCTQICLGRLDLEGIGA